MDEIASLQMHPRTRRMLRELGADGPAAIEPSRNTEHETEDPEIRFWSQVAAMVRVGVLGVFLVLLGVIGITVPPGIS